MKRNASSEDGDNGEGPSKIPKEVPLQNRKSTRYTSKIKSTAHGFEYQEELALLLLLRATRRKVNFRLAYEMSDAGLFDDVVFINEDKKECLLFQVKHSLKLAVKTSMDMVSVHMLFPKTDQSRKDGIFSLFQYLKSFSTDQQDLSEEKRFIIFTNRTLIISDKLLEKITIEDEHLAKEDILYFNDSTEKPKRFKPKDEVAKEMMNYVNRNLAEKLSLNNAFDFFENFALYFNQPDELKEIIRNEWLGWMREWMHPVDLGKRDKEHDYKSCFAKLKECLDHDSKYDNKTKTKTFLTLTQGQKYLFETREHLEDLIRAHNYRTTLEKVEDYFIDRLAYITNATDNNGYDLHTLLTDEYAEDKIIVLTAKPGMGKSALFHHVSLQVQQSSDNLVFLIYLNNLVNNLKQFSKIDSLQTTLNILGDVLVASNRNLILSASKNENSNGQRIRLFLDGFDEIAPMHEDKVIQMIETLKMINRIQIIVSGRRHVENMLKDKFEDARTLYLMPFSKQDQIAFLRKKWKVSAENYSKFNTYSAHIRDELDSCMGNRWCDFLGIPLIIKMFADVKHDDFSRFISSNETQNIRLQSYTVVKLYEKFIENSRDLKFDKMYESGCRENESKDEFYQKHQLLAVHQLECLGLLHQLDNPSMKTIFDQFVQKIKRGEERSPLVECVNGEVQFIHRSYAEYMVAKYLYDNIEESKMLFNSPLILGIYDRKYNIIRKFLMNMIEEQGKPEHFQTIVEMCKIHKYWTVRAVFEEGCSRIVEYLIENNSSFVNSFYLHSFDDTTPIIRQPIHFAAEYGNEKIIHMLVKKGANINAHCSNKSTALHYAIEHKEVVQLLFNYSVNVNARNNYAETALHVALERNQTEIAKMLIEHQIDDNKMIAVNYAARFGKFYILRPILNKMVQKTYQDGLGRNPLHNANSESYADACKVELERLLSQTSLDVNFQDFEGKTPLHYAATTCQQEIVRVLLEKTENANLQDFEGKTALHYAVEAGNYQIVELLLEQTEEANLQDFEGRTSLHFASKAGHYQIVKLLLKKYEDVDIIDYEGKLPIDYASDAGNHRIMELLLPKATDKEPHNFQGKSRLHYAAEAGLLQNVESLLGKLEDIDLVDNNLRTPLHYAAMKGHYQIAELLLNKSSNVDSLDVRCMTPLQYAASKGHHQIVELLLKKPVDVDAQNFERNTSLHYAAEEGHHQVIESLLEEPIDVNIQNVFEQTPLLLAAKAGKHQIVQLVFDKSEDVNLKMRDTEGGTLLHYTAKTGLIEIVSLLLGKAVDVDLQDNFGKTPLHYAAEAGHYKIVTLLLKSANVLLYDNDGRIPLHYAAKAGQQKTVELLLEKPEFIHLW